MKYFQCILFFIVLSGALPTVWASDYEIPVSYSLDHGVTLRARGTITSRGFGRKSRVAYGAFDGKQSVDAQELMASEYYTVMIDSSLSNTSKIFTSTKTVCFPLEC